MFGSFLFLFIIFIWKYNYHHWKEQCLQQFHLFIVIFKMMHYYYKKQTNQISAIIKHKLLLIKWKHNSLKIHFCLFQMKSLNQSSITNLFSILHTKTWWNSILIVIKNLDYKVEVVITLRIRETIQILKKVKQIFQNNSIHNKFKMKVLT